MSGEQSESGERLTEAEYRAWLERHPREVAAELTGMLPAPVREAGIRFDWDASAPGRIIPVTAMLTEEELARLEAAWRDAMHSRRWAACPPLPRRVRLRLAAVRRRSRKPQAFSVRVLARVLERLADRARS